MPNFLEQCEAELVDGDGGVVDCCKACREPWPPGMVTAFVPPAIFDEMQGVFDLPMPANVANISSAVELGGSTQCRDLLHFNRVGC